MAESNHHYGAAMEYYIYLRTLQYGGLYHEELKSIVNFCKNFQRSTSTLILQNLVFLFQIALNTIKVPHQERRGRASRLSIHVCSEPRRHEDDQLVNCEKCDVWVHNKERKRPARYHENLLAVSSFEREITLFVCL